MTNKNSKKSPPKRHPGARAATASRDAKPGTSGKGTAPRGRSEQTRGGTRSDETSAARSGRTPQARGLTSKSPTASAPPKRRSADAHRGSVAQRTSDARGAHKAAPGRGATKHSVPLTETSEDSGALDSNDYAMLGIGSRILPPDTELDELFDEEPTAASPAESPDAATVAARIRDLEARLDGMMRAAIGAPPEAAAPVASPLHAAEDAPNRELNDTTAVEAARELLESDYYRRTWGKAGLRAHAEEIDDFGFDPDFEHKAKPLLRFLFKRYFRVETRGIDNIPESGRAVIVANHSGTLPLDGVMLREALREHHRTSRDLRWLAEDFLFYLPFIGVAMNRLGAVRACQENAQRLLTTDHLIAVFPEGEKGIKKLFGQRYQLQRFGRGGYIRLCLRTKSPLIPCAIVGAEETNPMLYRFDNASRLLGLDYLPVTPTFPWLGPLGLVPAPTKWRIAFGEPIELEGYGPEAADDHVLIGRLSERVRTTISSMLDGALRTRRSIWL